MSVLLRARIASFLSGVAVTSVFAIYQLRKELVESHQLLQQQVQQHGMDVEERIRRLEMVISTLPSVGSTQAPSE